MTETQLQILELFSALAPSERHELARILTVQTVEPSVFDTLTPEQQAELDTSIAQADRGEGDPVASAFDRLTLEHGLSRTA